MKPLSSSDVLKTFWITYIESSSPVSISIIISRTHVRDSNDLPRFSDEYAWNQHSLSSREWKSSPAINGQSVLCSSHTATIFYVGETDSFPTRLSALSRLQKKIVKNNVVIPQGKSHARRLENKFISILRTLEFLCFRVPTNKKHFEDCNFILFREFFLRPTISICCCLPITNTFHIQFIVSSNAVPKSSGFLCEAFLLSALLLLFKRIEPFIINIFTNPILPIPKQFERNFWFIFEKRMRFSDKSFEINPFFSLQRA